MYAHARVSWHAPTGAACFASALDRGLACRTSPQLIHLLNVDCLPTWPPMQECQRALAAIRRVQLQCGSAAAAPPSSAAGVVCAGGNDGGGGGRGQLHPLHGRKGCGPAASPTPLRPVRCRFSSGCSSGGRHSARHRHGLPAAGSSAAVADAAAARPPCTSTSAADACCCSPGGSQAARSCCRANTGQPPSRW